MQWRFQYQKYRALRPGKHGKCHACERAVHFSYRNLCQVGRTSRLAFSFFSPANDDHAHVHVIGSDHALTNRIPPPGRGRRARRRKSCAPGVRNLPRSRSSRGRTSCRTGGTTARTRVRTTTSTRASSSPGTKRPTSDRGERVGRVCFRKGLSSHVDYTYSTRAYGNVPRFMCTYRAAS